MRDTPVENVGPGHAAPHGLGARLDLGLHAAHRSPAAQDLVDDVEGGLMDQGGRVVGDDPQPLDVGEEDQLLGASASASAPATVSALML